MTPILEYCTSQHAIEPPKLCGFLALGVGSCHFLVPCRLFVCLFAGCGMQAGRQLKPALVGNNGHGCSCRNVQKLPVDIIDFT